LRLNILSTFKNFPKHRVVLIHNQKKNFFLPKNIIQYSYTQSELASDIEKTLNHPHFFRRNFWFASIARFDAIRSFMTENQGPIIHVESDVILSSDFPISTFEDADFSIAYPVVADQRGVASTVYVRDLATATNLTRFCLSAVKTDPKTTDMEILAEYKSEPKQDFRYLPFGPGGRDNYIEYEPVANQSDAASIDGVIDGNDIGVNLFGTDPRNTRGFSFLGQNIVGNYADTKNWKMVYSKKRKFISLLELGIEVPVYTLHATCKNKFLFFSLTRSIMMRIFLWRRVTNHKKVFYPGIVLHLAIQKILRIVKG
jgi:hypothetical protein